MHKFLFVDGDDNINLEVWVEAETEKQAHKLAWESLTSEQKDALGCLDCVDVVEA